MQEKHIDRINKYITKTDDCWLWNGSLSHGYGQYNLEGKTVRAHRIVYEMLIGKIPKGLELDHLCRNRACVNPSHLEPVTTKENILRGKGSAALNARKKICPKCGGKYEFIKSKSLKNGQRMCRRCKNESCKLYMRKKFNFKPLNRCP